MRNEVEGTTFIEMISTRVIVVDKEGTEHLLPFSWFELKVEQGIMPYLLLDDIKDQVIKQYGESVIIDVWVEHDLSGSIYQFCKPDYDKWVKHGSTRGYA